MDHRLEILAELATTIAAKRSAAPDLSYTAKLLAEGVEKCAKKLGEEAIEAALAAASGNKPNLTAEAADLLYHLLVLLEAADVTLADVMAELEHRKGVGGIAEKSARKQV
jgi:phosphoribosyl-ATP pyrophosphohydrolase